MKRLICWLFGHKPERTYRDEYEWTGMRVRCLRCGRGSRFACVPHWVEVESWSRP